MRHRNKVKTLDRTTGARRALLRGLATNLFIYEKIKTTLAKAKALRPIAERLITVAKKNDLNARRRLIKYLYTENAVKKALNQLGPKYKDRAGGYTRIVKIGPRAGDNADIALIEFV